ncbi:MAG: HAD family hydrolase [Actinomycetota bacterium]|nr:HAD family hydrolase [Actinomycetota bacterium]
MPQAILFDAGGTLVNVHPQGLGDLLGGQRPQPQRIIEAHYRAIAELSSRGDLACSPSEEWWPWWVGRFFELAGIEGQEAANRFRAASGLWAHPVPGAREAVEALRARGLRVAVVSNSDGTALRNLEAAGFGDLFEFVIDSRRLAVAKPDPGIFRMALDRLGLPAREVWYVGDSYFHDILGARGAGLGEAVLVDPLGLAPAGQASVASVAELPAMLGRITS